MTAEQIRILEILEREGSSYLTATPQLYPLVVPLVKRGLVEFNIIYPHAHLSITGTGRTVLLCTQ